MDSNSIRSSTTEIFYRKGEGTESTKVLRQRYIVPVSDLWIKKEHAKLAAIKSVESRTPDTIRKLSESVKKSWENIEFQICPHCSFKGKGVGMRRWHLNNCKKRG